MLDVFLALFLGLLILFIIKYVFFGFGSRFGKEVLLLGPEFSGKTSLFTRLAFDDKVAETFMSMKQNSAVVSLEDKKTFNLVDIPGNDRVRYGLLDKHKSSARGILYTMDSSTLQKQIRDATEYLFKVLSDPVIHKNKIPIAIVCNKQDKSMSKGMGVIQKELEKEIDLLRGTHSKTLTDTSGSNVEGACLGKEGQSFTFKDLKHVTFLESNTQDSNGLEELKKWINSIV